jgi:hypothetical protein
MASKKKTKKVRHTKEWLRRSAAAKKGVITRKRNEKIAKRLLELAAKVKEAKANARKRAQRRKAQGKPKVKAKPKKRTVKRKGKLPSKVNRKLISRLIDENASLKKQLEQQRFFDSLVDVLPLEWLHEDMSIALYPSSLRHHEDTQHIRGILKIAESKGKKELRRAARIIANSYEVPLREVYTLHLSP